MPEKSISDSKKFISTVPDVLFYINRTLYNTEIVLEERVNYVYSYKFENAHALFVPTSVTPDLQS